MTEHELSDIDITPNGMHNFNDCEGKILTGIICYLDINSDEYLDAMIDGSIETYLRIN